MGLPPDARKERCTLISHTLRNQQLVKTAECEGNAPPMGTLCARVRLCRDAVAPSPPPDPRGRFRAPPLGPRTRAWVPGQPVSLRGRLPRHARVLTVANSIRPHPLVSASELEPAGSFVRPGSLDEGPERVPPTSEGCVHAHGRRMVPLPHAAIRSAAGCKDCPKRPWC